MAFFLFLAGTALAQNPKQSESFKGLTDSASLIVVARIKSVGKPPAVWSSHVATSQSVRYQVLEILKGSLRAKEMDVQIYVSKTSQLVDSVRPELSGTIFIVGKRHILFFAKSNDAELAGEGRKRVRTHPDQFLTLVSADSPNLQKMRELVK